MATEKIVVGRTREDLKAFGGRGTVLLGKHIVGEGEEAHLTNPLEMDVARPHIVLICGKRGTGKCLHGDTLISLEDGSQVPIKNLERDTQRVYGLNTDLKITPLQKTDFFKRKVNTLIHVRTRSGREIQLTPEHPLLTIRGWKPAKELIIGSRIATPRKMGFGVRSMEDCKIKLLAYLLAEGHIKKNGNRALARFTNMDEQIVEDFRQSLREFDPSLKMTLYRKGTYGIAKTVKTIDPSGIRRDENHHFVKGSIARPKRNSLIVWLESIGAYDKFSVEKIIPPEICLLTKEKTALFLNRLFSCDGSIYKHKTGHGIQWQISYSSSSKILIHQVQHLVLRFGILSKIRKKNVLCNGKQFESYEIVIGSEHVNSFLKSIGLFGKKSIPQRERLAEPATNYNPNVDTIPKEIWELYRPKSWTQVGRALGYSIPKGLRTSLHYAPSRQKLMQISHIDSNAAIEALAASDIFWDEIMSIEQLEGDFDVYDIAVPEMHNFVASDIIVHNSYSGAVIAEEIALLPPEVRSNLSVLLVDTMGIYWSMKNPNTREAGLLREWGLKPRGLEVKLFVPRAHIPSYQEVGIEVDSPLALPASALTAMDWILTFGFSPLDEHGIALERAVKACARPGYGLEDLVYAVQADKKSVPAVKDALLNRFLSAQDWEIFEKKGTPTEQLLQPGGISVIDVSHFASLAQGWSVKGVLLGLLARQIYQQRLMARKAEESEVMTGEQRGRAPLVWMIIDEAHEFLPSRGETPASRPLLTVVKQGREPGISLVLITQQPNKLHADALSQADLVIAHRLTAKADLEALRGIMQSYLLEDIQEYINSLPRQKGAAIILDDNSERIYTVQVRPRLSWHAGGSPSALRTAGTGEE